MREASSDSDTDGEQELGSSQLGRQEYWEETYRKELANFEEHGDEGEIWFGQDVLSTAVQFTADVLRRLHGQHANSLAIYEAGCGNGTMLVALAEEGFKNLSGGDYSSESLALASKVLAHHGLSHIRVGVDDLMTIIHREGVHVVVDKGTLDAIGLSNVPNARAQYRSTIWHMLHPSGLLIITSCNSTRDELIEEYCGPDGAEEPCAYNMHNCSHTRWKLVDWVKTYPTFRFGGVEGSRVCTVALEKRLPGPSR